MGRNGGGLHGLLLDEGVPDRGARLYLAACREGPQTASELARRCQLNRVDAYRFIRDLIDRGLLRSTGGRPMRFAALSPEQLLDRLHHQASERARSLESERDKILHGWREALGTSDENDGRRFTVLEGTDSVYRFLRRKLGAAEKEVWGCFTPAALARVLDQGLDRTLREARDRGVRVRVLTPVDPETLALARTLEGAAEIRHSPMNFGVASLVFDRSGMFVNISDHYANGASLPLVGLWSASPELNHSGREYFRHVWGRSTPFTQRLVELDGPSPATISLAGGVGDEDALLRLREVAELGMRVTGVGEVKLDLAGLIGAIGRQLGHEISGRLTGESPPDVVRALAAYYAEHALGEVRIVRDRPFTLRVDGCFSRTVPSNEVARLLCPAILGAALEGRLGSRWSVAASDSARSRNRACVFTIVPT
ncbi:MAG TPA: helix-turn-helix domain-containing protein [Thermoplasmata archaeon]|nr:helix-turn-helix domain-containing protein [Thermoplasmata archaeon]